MKNFPLVSVYTCVYNGARTLSRVFESMKNLNYPNIEHIIINDGSTDTTDQLIQEYIKQVSFKVKYHKKENGGKHSALNVAYGLAEGMFMINLDADDELLPNSLNFLVDTYFKIPEDMREEYWRVHGRCITQHGDFVGKKYPGNINSLPWREAGVEARKHKGEKIGLQVRKYLSQYRFPEVVGVSHISENIVSRQLNQKYGTWYTNEVVRVYYVNEGGNLCAKKTKRSQYSPLCYRLKLELMHPVDYGNKRKNLLLYPLCYFISDKKFRDNNKYTEGLKRYSVILSLICPFAYLGAIVFRLIKRIK